MFRVPDAFKVKTMLREIADFFAQIQEELERWISKRMLKAIVFLFASAVLLMVLGGSIAIFEYRTSWFAEQIGDVLADTNIRRRAVGSIWTQLRGRAEVQETLDDGATFSLPESGDGLPAAVSVGRFRMDRVPEGGMPGFVAVWRTQVASGQQREMPEVVESLRIFRIGLALLEAAALPDVRYRGRVRQEIAALYQQVGDVGEVEAAAGDSVMAVPADSVRAAVVAELAREITDRVRREEQAALLEDYRVGRVGQILLQRGLGLYQGEVSYHDPETSRITFEIKPEQVARIFKVDISENE